MRVVFPRCQARVQVKGYDLHGVVLDVASFSNDQRRVLNRVTRVEDPFDLQLIDVAFVYYRLWAVPGHGVIIVYIRPVLLCQHYHGRRFHIVRVRRRFTVPASWAEAKIINTNDENLGAPNYMGQRCLKSRWMRS